MKTVSKYISSSSKLNDDLSMLNQDTYLLSVLATVTYFTSASLNNKAIPQDGTLYNVHLFIRKTEKIRSSLKLIFVVGLSFCETYNIK